MKKEECTKITFTGDIMCEKAMLDSYFKDKSSDFDDIFMDIKDFLKESDYIVGNLETPVDDHQKYTNDIFSFNTPSSFLDTLKKVGINYVSISNNHMMDRGNKGLKNTLSILQKKGFKIIGIDKECNFSTKIQLNNFNLSLISCTYGINYNVHYQKINKKFMNKFLFLKNPNDYSEKFEIKWITKIKQKLKKTFIYDVYKKLKKSDSTAITPSIIHDDLGKMWNFDMNYINKINDVLKNEKKSSDLVILLSHCGGQFNVEVGSFTKKNVESLDSTSYDAYIGAHPHIVQKMLKQEKKIVAYSLGNFLVYPKSAYLVLSTLPTYGILLHLYISKNNPQKYYYTFSITKCVLENNRVKILLVDDLLNRIKDDEEKEKIIQENLIIYNRFMNTNEKKLTIQREYNI